MDPGVWGLSSSGVIISTTEETARLMASRDSNVIFFFADLGASNEVTHSEETLYKVRDALFSVGLSDKQVLDAINAMFNSGIIFRERV